MKLLTLAILPFLFVSCGFEIVDTGFRGIQTNFGKVTKAPLDEGLHFYNPMTSDIVELEVREIKREGSTMAYTKDVQNADIKFAVSYSLNPNAVGGVYKEAGTDWQHRFIPQRVQASIKEIIGQYEATDLVKRRAEATAAINELLRGKLAEKHISLRGIEITNIDYNDKFERAVEAKVVAVQRAQEAKNKTVQIREEKTQRILKAEGEAKAMEIRAKALSSNKGLVEYEAVQKWDGKLPVYMMGGKSMPFIKLGSK